MCRLLYSMLYPCHESHFEKLQHRVKVRLPLNWEYLTLFNINSISSQIVQVSRLFRSHPRHLAATFRQYYLLNIFETPKLPGLLLLENVESPHLPGFLLNIVETPHLPGFLAVSAVHRRIPARRQLTTRATVQYTQTDKQCLADVDISERCFHSSFSPLLSWIAGPVPPKLLVKGRYSYC